MLTLCVHSVLSKTPGIGHSTALTSVCALEVRSLTQSSWPLRCRKIRIGSFMERELKEHDKLQRLRSMGFCSLIFFSLLEKRQRKPPKKQGFLMLAEPLKSFRKKGKPLKFSRISLKRIWARKFQKARERSLLLWMKKERFVNTLIVMVWLVVVMLL